MHETPASFRLLCFAWAITNLWGIVSWLQAPATTSLFTLFTSIIFGFGALYFAVTLPKHLQPGHTAPFKIFLVATFILQLLASLVAPGAAGLISTLIVGGALTWYLLWSIKRISVALITPSGMQIPSTPVANTGSGKRMWILIGIFLVLVVGITMAAGYIKKQNLSSAAAILPLTSTTTASTPSTPVTVQTTTVSPAPVLAPTPTWKTYTDSDFGYSIKYPASWGTPTTRMVANHTVTTLTDGFTVSIGQLPGANGQPTTYNELRSYFASGASGGIYSDTTIGGNPGFTLLSPSQKTNSIVQAYAYTPYPGNNMIFEISYGLNPIRNLTDSDVSLFNKIVGTISFTR
jgi:hypothetical protein